MTNRFLAATLLAILPLHAQAAHAEVPMRVDFESDEPNALPSGFSAELTGGGGPVKWVVREDAGAPSGRKVLVQTSTDETSHRFPPCIYNRLLTKNVVLSVRFKALTGTVDQAAGLVVRFRDKDNYYVVRANALEDNVKLYRVVDGKREQFAGADIEVSAQEWHTLKLSLRMDHFEVWFDGKHLFEADDTTHPETGELGLWTKADSVTAFDDFWIEDSDAGH